MTTSQTPVHIGNVIRNAVVFDLKNWLESPMNADSLPQAIRHLFALLQKRQINYVLVGGVALLTYIEGRNTQDEVRNIVLEIQRRIERFRKGSGQ